MSRQSVFLGSAAAALLASGSAAMADAAPPAFQICMACHSIAANGANSVGPNLRGVVGRRAGSHAGYAYSDAVKKSGLVWTRDKLDAWLTGPSRLVPGTRMAINVSSANDRKAIITYLAGLH